jgi:hypothetical protein
MLQFLTTIFVFQRCNKASFSRFLHLEKIHIQVPGFSFPSGLKNNNQKTLLLVYLQLRFRNFKTVQN